MADPLELIAVEVSANLTNLDKQMQGAARVVDVNAQKITQSIQGAERSIIVSADNASEAMERTGGSSRMLAAQFSQMGQQVIAGTSPLQALAIQLPDLAVVMGQTGNEAGKLASFFGGPWGIALTTAIAVAASFTEKLWDTDDALKSVGVSAQDAIAKLQASLNATSLATSAADATTKSLVTAMGDLAKANREIAQTQRLLDETATRPGGANAVEGLMNRMSALQRDRTAAQRQIDGARRELSEISRLADVAAMQAQAREKLAQAPSASRPASSRPRSSRGATSSTSQMGPTDRDVQRQEEMYQKTLAQLELQQRLAQLRSSGSEAEAMLADMMEARARIEQQFPELARSTREEDQKRLQVLLDIANATIGEGYQRKAAKEAAEEQRKSQEDLKRQRERDAVELAHQQEQQIRTLGSLYEDAFRGGTKAIWQDFKDIGFRVVAQVLARFTIAKLGGGGGGTFDFGSAFASAIGSVLPGFATGGSIAIGGRGGTDNNVLAVNGQPVARVSNGETLHITNPNLSRGGAGSAIVQQTFVLDNRGGITTPELLDYVNQTANARAIQAASAMGQSVMKAVPSRLASYNRDGT